ncbi:2-hydroxychromene-2-carboxylate isomerase [Duganella radicis]|uniref:2-hydroxychromene-2-carboxylate isomerase n=1 Tax=Duganella radicis TaxID=551988 RepID=A0A6L6PGS1_9BURK|nr:2-hydroxychromene-2-carboxylate isomerase [Duganella radicis]MTV38192.1 2-hydroxychromene-2-carboxylate isomerase [Duganella radicis]
MKEIACWFDFASNYSYLSVLRLARQKEVAVQWKPFLLGPIFKEQGWDNSPFVLQKDKGDYVWQDMPRECAKYGLPWRQPSEFPRRSLLAARVALLGEHQPWMAEFCARTMLANFEHDEDIGSEAVIATILTGIGLDAAALLTAAQSDDNKVRLRARGEEARSLHIFGAPTFFVGPDMYWGNDRLTDALARATG